ncbi:MAG TPA: TrkH family potassium uptake protein [Symbiobacteriaceae bacterium]|nr:TrkH family potassium uptake protein [Symbiobacteriaceae bacterium]
MLRPPSARDLRAIAFYSGNIVVWFGVLMLIPIGIGLVEREWQPVLDFATGMGLCLAAGFGLQLFWKGPPPALSGTAGLVSAAVSWLVCLVAGAIPYYLTGYYLTFLDALFDTMSGFTTTGLTLIQDINHLPDSVNTWRMFISWLGGQGMVVLALSFFTRGLPGAYKIYAGEDRDERLLPNVIHTARAVWVVSAAYLMLGTLMAWLAGLSIGLMPGRAFLHGLWMFMAAFSTGGFAPYGQNLLYYHSFAFELVMIVCFVVGSFNFNLHWSLFTGNRQEIRKNLELVTFLITATLLVALGTYGLGQMSVYTNVAGLVRKGFLQLISAHTTTGFMTVYARQLILEWGPAAMVAIVIAMMLGGSASSTAGGFKAFRVGIVFKALVYDLKRLLLPESAVTVQKFHMFRSAVLDDRTARSAMTIILLYVATVAGTTAMGALAGYDFLPALFEAASVTSNVGLSAGLTTVATPWFLKVTYILVMWVGRLEFMSVFALIGYVYAGVRGR